MIFQRHPGTSFFRQMGGRQRNQMEIRGVCKKRAGKTALAARAFRKVVFLA